MPKNNRFSEKPLLVHITTVPITLAFLSGQVSFMKSRGLRIHAISSPGSLLEKFSAQEKIQVHPVKMSRKITPFDDLQALFRILCLLRKLKPKIVHSHTPKAGLLGMIAARLLNVPVRIYHIHGFPFMTSKGMKRSLLISSEKLSCKFSNQVFCVSRSIREFAISKRICQAKKIKTLLNGSINGVDAIGAFDPSKLDLVHKQKIRKSLGIPMEAIVVGFVGRLVKDKGIEELFCAWKALKDGIHNLRLLLIGPFEPNDPLKKDTMISLHRDSRIHLVGFVQKEELPSYYSAMDFFVLPSYREGFPVTPLEAGAMELPVVGTNIPGCVDA
ncbi:glycosyltransferase family 4 protein, partial [bacterium]|nr:glycosyltransferase family 4 protein [bacterium]